MIFLTDARSFGSIAPSMDTLHVFAPRPRRKHTPSLWEGGAFALG